MTLSIPGHADLNLLDDNIVNCDTMHRNITTSTIPLTHTRPHPPRMVKQVCGSNHRLSSLRNTAAS
jgi:hypothetical protein